MYTIQNFYFDQKRLLGPFLEPSVLTVAALIASRKRLIQYFPGTSHGGLHTLNLVTVVFLTYYESNQYRPENEYPRTLLGRAVAISCTTVVTTLASKIFPYQITLRSAARFGVVQLIFTAVSTKASWIYDQHCFYSRNINQWQKLDVDESYGYIVAFFRKNLPVIDSQVLLSNLSLINDLQIQEESVLRFSEEQIEWCKQVVPLEGFDIPTLVAFNMRCHQLNLEVAKYQLTSDLIQYIRCHEDNQPCIRNDLITQFKSPQGTEDFGYSALPQEDQRFLFMLFQKVKKESLLPFVNDTSSPETELPRSSLPPSPSPSLPSSPETKPVIAVSVKPSSAQKDVKVYIGGSDKPFYLGRKGFPNPSNCNCDYNSMGIVIAHATDAGTRDSDYIFFRDRDSTLRVCSEHQNTIRELENSIKKLEEESTTRKVQLEGQLMQARQTLVNEEKKETQNREKVRQIRRTLRILRGEETGSLTEADAKDMEEYIEGAFQKRPLHGKFPLYHRGRIDAENDSTVTKNGVSGKNQLYQALYESDWRVIRVGGHGHWYAFVRDPNALTVTVINDSCITPNKTFDSILREWSNPKKWEQVQLTFY